MYENELTTLKRAGRFRERRVFKEHLIDLASNDYLGLAQNKELLANACRRLEACRFHAPKASMLVSGYSSLHRDFEDELCLQNGFEGGIVVGSGYLANLALIEALVRKGDVLFMDESFHASGIMASRLCQGKVVFFAHNDPEDLEKKLKSTPGKRVFIAVEGIYSMEGDLLKREFFDVAKRSGAVMIVDEAHSSGVLGADLLGVFNHYAIKPEANHIKMGTLGKAYGSYGAYILASKEIISFLENRAKPIIYSTALSLFDTVLAHEAIMFVAGNKELLRKEIAKRRTLVLEALGIGMEGLIASLEIGSSHRALLIQECLLSKGYLIGAIRPPTVKRAILRIIPGLGVSFKELKRFLDHLKEEL